MKQEKSHTTPEGVEDLQWGDLEAVKSRLERIQDGMVANGSYAVTESFCVLCGRITAGSCFKNGDPNGQPHVCIDCRTAMAYAWMQENVNLASRLASKDE